MREKFSRENFDKLLAIRQTFPLLNFCLYGIQFWLKIMDCHKPFPDLFIS